MRPEQWPTRLPALFELAEDPSLTLAIEIAVGNSSGVGDVVRAAASTALDVSRRRPDARPLAMWLADAARRLGWPAPVPLLSSMLRAHDWRALREGRAEAWVEGFHFAYARGAAAAVDLYADLCRRTSRLFDVAPQLRSKDADTTVAILISENAQPAKTGKTTSDRSSRRLFDRLVALGGARELTGRSTSRLYGL